MLPTQSLWSSVVRYYPVWIPDRQLEYSFCCVWKTRGLGWRWVIDQCYDSAICYDSWSSNWSIILRQYCLFGSMEMHPNCKCRPYRRSGSYANQWVLGPLPWQGNLRNLCWSILSVLSKVYLWDRTTWDKRTSWRLVSNMHHLWNPNRFLYWSWNWWRRTRRGRIILNLVLLVYSLCHTYLYQLYVDSAPDHSLPVWYASNVKKKWRSQTLSFDGKDL